MRQGLESAGNSLNNLEAETSMIEERLQEIDGILKQIEASIFQADARGDCEIAVSLQKNLSQKQVEYERQEHAKKQIAIQLHQLGTETGQLQDQNNRSRAEVAQLNALGEDVSAGMALIQERQEILQFLEQRYQNLLKRLEQMSFPTDVKFIDKSGNSITVRTWESGKQVMARAYDMGVVQVPDNVNLGQAGHAEASLEQFNNSQLRLHLTYIETSREYRGLGIGGQLLNQVERFGQEHGASMIYGTIENQDAQNFWCKQANRGWMIDHNRGVYGEVSKRLK